jgi:hypothetical protein
VWADTNYVVPSGRGTITTFFYASIPANAGQQIDFLILRPTGRGNYTVVGKTGLVTLAGGPQGGSRPTLPSKAAISSASGPPLISPAALIPVAALLPQH